MSLFQLLIVVIPKYKLLETNDTLVHQIVCFFTSAASNPQLFLEVKEKCRGNQWGQNTNQDKFLDMGYLSKKNFLCYMSKTNQIGQGISTFILDLVIDLLVKNFFLQELRPNTIHNTESRYLVDPSNVFVKYFVETRLIYNCIYGFNYIAERYRSAIFKIEIETTQGNLSLGTGFLLHETNLIITNRHIVKDKNVKAVKNIYDINDKIVEFDQNNIKVCENDDIALIPLKDKIDVEGLIPNIYFDILDEIITMGYPKVATTKAAYLVSHKGEINSKIENQQNNQLFLISAKTSPGSSGSPIIDKTGSFIGIVSRNLYPQSDPTKTSEDALVIPYHAGIPTLVICNFHESIKQQNPSWLVL